MLYSVVRTEIVDGDHRRYVGNCSSEKNDDDFACDSRANVQTNTAAYAEWGVLKMTDMKMTDRRNVQA